MTYYSLGILVPATDEEADYRYYLRYRKVDDSPFARKRWSRSKAKGRYAALFYRKRRAECGPGRLWGYTSGTVFLNNRIRRGAR